MVEVKDLPVLSIHNFQVNYSHDTFKRRFDQLIYFHLGSEPIILNIGRVVRRAEKVVYGTFLINSEYDVIAVARVNNSRDILLDIDGKKDYCSSYLDTGFWRFLHLYDKSTPTQEDIINHLKSF